MGVLKLRVAIGYKVYYIRVATVSWACDRGFYSCYYSCHRQVVLLYASLSLQTSLLS